MVIDWAALRARLQESDADSHRRVFFAALIRRGEAAEAGQPALALHCRGRVEVFLASQSSAHSPARPDSKPVATIATSPLEGLKKRWEQSARARAAWVLQRHGRRLTATERAAYGDWIPEVLAENLTALRRRLQDRLLRAYARRRAGNSGMARGLKFESGSGPYNAQATLAAVLSRAATADSDWTREWMSLYTRMEKTLRMCRELRPPR